MTRRQRCIPKFTLLRVLLSVGAVWRTSHSKCTRATVFSSRIPTKRDVLDPLWNLRVVTEPAQSLGLSPQLNWRLPINRHKGLALEESPQLNWSPQEHHKDATKATKPSRVQRPKSNNLLAFTSTNHRGELKPMHQMQWQEHHKDAQVLLSQIPTKLQKLLGE